MKPIPCKDHTGKEFGSITEMCKVWGISYDRFKYRYNRSKNIEFSLTGEFYSRCKKKCKDHTGKEFDTIKDMCKAWDITYGVYRGRKLKGCSLEECLIGKAL